LVKSKPRRGECAHNSGSPPEKQKQHKPEPWILLFVAAVYLAVTLTSAPLLGARKDWDVFAPPWIFITMLGVYLLSQIISDDRIRGRILLVVIAISLLCTTPWILSNSRIDLDGYLNQIGTGSMYIQEGLTNRALEHYETALDMNFTPELAFKIARLRMENGDMDGAAEMLKKAIREENRSELAVFLEQEDAYFALGSIYLSKGETEEAISQFNQALDLWRLRHNENFKRAPDVYYHLGLAYLKQGDVQSAENAFFQSIELADLPPAHLALAKLYAREPGKKALAFKHLSKYLQKNPGDTAAVKLLDGLKPAAPPMDK
jgi:lipopolysaccharide biosynthesis regulator YciM